MKNSYKIFITFVVLIVGIIFLMNSCAPSAAIQGKQGAQLWGENCQRCHNVPPPNAFSDGQWNVIGRHMQLRANLTDDEIKKVVEFMQSAN